MSLKFSEFVSLSDVDEVLTEEVLALLEGLEPLNSQAVETIGKLQAGDIAKAIAAANEGLKRKSIAIANAVLSRLKDAGYVKPAEQPIPAIPSEITIKQEASIENMGIKGLIEVIIEGGDLKIDAWRRLIAMPDVDKAVQRTAGLAWVINGSLDIDRTVAYIQLMIDPYSRKQSPDRSKNERLLTLGEALGVETRCYIHPLDGSLLRGADEFGIDWVQQLDPETHKAAVWSLKSGSKIHPGFSYDAAQQLLQGGAAWSLIASAYWAAIDQKDSLALGIQIYQEPTPDPIQQSLDLSLPSGVDKFPYELLGSRTDEYDLWIKKLTRIRNALAIETDVARRFQYEQQIKEIEKSITGIKSALGIGATDDSYYENLVRDQSMGDERISVYNRTIYRGVYNNVYVGSHRRNGSEASPF